MRTEKQVKLSQDKHVSVVRSSVRLADVRIVGEGTFAILTIAEAQALYGALRDMDLEGLLVEGLS